MWNILKRESKKKSVLITGCDSGFGFSLASHLSETRPDVLTIACCFYPDGMSPGGNELCDKKNVIVLKLDVTKDASVQAVVTEVDKILEEEKAELWAVVNNAATLVFADSVWQTRY